MLPSDVSCFPIQIPTIPSSFEIYSCFRYFSVEKPSPTASSSAVGRGDIGRTRGTFQRDVPARNLETPLLHLHVDYCSACSCGGQQRIHSTESGLLNPLESVNKPDLESLLERSWTLSCGNTHTFLLSSLLNLSTHDRIIF